MKEKELKGNKLQLGSLRTVRTIFQYGLIAEAVTPQDLHNLHQHQGAN